MTDVERRRRPRIGWIDRSIRSKALVVVVAPTALLGAVAAGTAWFASGTLMAVDVAVLVLAVGTGLVLWHSFTENVVSRLRRLEQETDRIEGAGPPGELPAGRDEIGRLAARLEEATAQARAHAEERDRTRRDLTDILTASPVVSLRYDIARRVFSYASPNVERLLGLTAEQAMADPAQVTARFHPDDGRALRDAFAAGRGVGEDRISMILRCRRDPASEQWHEVEAIHALEPDEDGMPRTVSAYLVDVSERQAALRAAEERRFLVESIFHASPDTIVVRDATGRVVLASSSVAELAGAAGTLPPDELIETAYRSGRLRRDDRRAIDALIADCMAGQRDLPPVVTTGRPDRGDRHVRTYETRGRPIFDQSGAVTGVVTVSRDISDRMELERSLRRATVEAERASEAKSLFLSRMSHELRTPLNAILGFAQLLELDELTEDQSSSVDQIQRAGQHLLSLINEVLDIARIEAGQLTVTTEPVAVGEVLEEVAALLAPMAEANAVHMMIEPGGARGRFVRADRQRLLQVLLNLGSNAVKYNEHGGTVAFRTESCPAGVRFSVLDSGSGIDPEQQDMLFVPFSRLGAERSAVEGTGVGLALSKQLVEVMGGTIGVESSPGRGSMFWVELQAAEPERAGAALDTGRKSAGTLLDAPASGTGRGPNGAGARQATPPPAAPPDPDPAEPAQLVVLHVEDNPSNASLVARILARRPHVRLLSADEAGTGLELARRHHPDLLLLDLHLPDMPGDEMLHRIHAVPELAGIRVVVVSADATPDRIRRLLDLGVDGYLTKPVDVDALLRLVDSQAQRQAAAGT